MLSRTVVRLTRLSNAAAKDGFGLGLAIVKNIVTMLSGKISLESEKGKGSRFTVEIPMQKAEEVPEKEIQTYIHRKDRNLNVIAIDNDEVLLLMLKEMYAQEGIHCNTCTDAADLMEMIRRKEYNLLLTDLNMPHINGFELLELLRSSNVCNSQTIPVVVATASGSCDAEELLERGFAGCLFKPFSISELMEVSDKCAIKIVTSAYLPMQCIEPSIAQRIALLPLQNRISGQSSACLRSKSTNQTPPGSASLWVQN